MPRTVSSAMIARALSHTVEQHAFGKFDHQPPGIDTELRDRGCYIIDETRGMELARAHVHGNRDRCHRFDIAPFAQTLTGVLQYPATKREDQSGRFGRGNELARGERGLAAGSAVCE